MLIAAKNSGLGKIEQIADAEAPKLGLPQSVCREYLSEVISFGLGDEELASLAKFAELCREHDLKLRGSGTEASEGCVRFCNVG